MAIPKELEGLMDGFSQEELTLFDNLMTKQYGLAKAKDPNAPTLQEGWLRQQEFDKKSNKWKKDMEAAQELSNARQRWYEENKPVHENALELNRKLEAEKQEWQQQQQELQQKLSEAEQRRAAEGGEPVDREELKRLVMEEHKAMGWLSKAEQQALIDEKTAQLTGQTDAAIKSAEKRLWEETFPQMANHALDISEIGYDHKTEFQEPIDRMKFTEFLSENKITDFKKGYEQFVKPRRDERDFKTRVEAEVTQRMSGLSVNGGMPVAGGPQPKGALQMRIEKDAAGPGSLTAAAAAAAAEMRSEGKY